MIKHDIHPFGKAILLLFIFLSGTLTAVLYLTLTNIKLPAVNTETPVSVVSEEANTETYPGDYTTVIREFDGRALKRIKTLSYKENDPYNSVVYDGFEFLYYRLGNVVYQYSLKTKSEKKVYAHTDTINTFSGMSAQPGGFLYISQGVANEVQMFEEMEILVIDTIEKPAQRRVIPAIPTVLYGGDNYIMVTSKYDVVGTFGGDGCGGTGEIYRWDDVEMEQILKVGSGCVTGPRYIGAVPDQDSLLMYNTKRDFEPEVDQGDVIKQLYLYNVDTKEEKVLVDFGLNEFQLVSAKINDVGTRVALQFSDHILEIDLVTGKEVRKVGNTNGINYIQYFSENKIYSGFSGSTGEKIYHNIVTLDLDTRDLQSVSPKEYEHERLSGVSILGVYDNKLILFDNRRNIPYSYEGQSN